MLCSSRLFCGLSVGKSLRGAVAPRSALSCSLSLSLVHKSHPPSRSLKECPYMWSFYSFAVVCFVVVIGLVLGHSFRHYRACAFSRRVCHFFMLRPEGWVGRRGQKSPRFTVPTTTGTEPFPVSRCIWVERHPHSPTVRLCHGAKQGVISSRSVQRGFLNR